MLKKLFRFLFQTTGDTIQSSGLLLLRIGVSIFMILLHGWPKLSNYLQGNVNFPDPIGLGVELSLVLAIFAEVICSFLLMLGLLTRIAVVPLAFTMIVVAFVVNAGRELIVSERALLFLIIYLFFLLVGSGKYSLDFYLYRKGINLKFKSTESNI